MATQSTELKNVVESDLARVQRVAEKLGERVDAVMGSAPIKAVKKHPLAAGMLVTGALCAASIGVISLSVYGLIRLTISKNGRGRGSAPG